MKTKSSSTVRRKIFLELEKLAKELEEQQRRWRTSRQEEEESGCQRELEAKHDQ